jgi:chromosome partitioning protein
MGLVVAVTNQKGGVGKTTTAINVAHALALAGREVLLVDFDPQANATSGVGAKEEPPLPQEHYLVSADTPVRCKVTRLPRLSLLPASPALQVVSKILAGAPDKDFRLKRALAAHREVFDYILIDCPPSISLFTSNALVAADAVLIPLQCEYFAMEGLAQMLAVIRSIRKGANPDLEILGILLTMFDADVDINREVLEEIRSHFASEVFDTVITRDVTLTEASSHAKTIFEYAPCSRAAFAYASLTREVLRGPRKEVRTRI